jgi:hypothetical protein
MKKTKKFKSLNCSPYVKTKKNKIKNSCLDKDLIKKLKKLYNMRHPDNKIKNSSPQIVHNKLKENLSGVCESEKCWIDNLIPNNQKKFVDKLFMPTHPREWVKNKNAWLSSIDISKVMKRYEHTYKDFMFIGPSPIDYGTIKDGICVYPELCNMDLKSLKNKGINKIGIVFNTDPHYLSGSHWVCVFVNIKDLTFFYFDSVGDDIAKETKNLYNMLNKQSLKYFSKSMKFIDTNGFEHQKSNTECGMYCLYVLINLLENNITIKSLQSKRISDNNVEKFRNIYFNTPLIN